MFGLREVPYLAFEVVAGLGRQTCVAFFARAARCFGADDVDAAAMRLGEEVGAQRSTSGIETVRVVPQAEEDLLDDFLGEGAIGDDAAGEPERGGRVAPVHLSQRVVAEASDRDDELGVAGEPKVSGAHVSDPLRDLSSVRTCV